MDNKTNYAVNFRKFQLYLSLGMKLSKIHRVLKFKQSYWMKKYIDLNSKKRTNAANNFEKDFLKIDDQFRLWQNNGERRKKNQYQASKQRNNFFKFHQQKYLVKIMLLFMKLNQF